jgi:hypothetical protein
MDVIAQFAQPLAVSPPDLSVRTRSAAGSLTRVDPISGSSWDELITRHPRATIFHTSAWARVLVDTYGYKPHYFAAECAGEPTAMCVLEVNSWVTGRRGISLPFTDECGLLSGGSHSFDELFQFGIEMGERQNWKSIEIRAGGAPTDLPVSLSFYSHNLQLNNDAEKLFGSFDPSVRRAIRKAQNSKLEISISSGFEAIRDYFQLHCITRQKHGLPPQSFQFFANIHRHIIGPGHGFVVLARKNGRTIAGAVFFRFRQTVLYKFGASDPEFDSLRANNLLMWSAIQHSCREGFRFLDFGRTSSHNDGLRRYKRSWGSEEKILNYIKWDFRKARFVKDKDQSTGFQNSFFGLCPVAVSRFLGKLIYPHIA